MQIYSNAFSILPVDLFGFLFSHLSREDAKKLAHTDKIMLKLSGMLIQSIRLFPPYSGSNKDAHEDTLVDIIKRYPNARKLTLGPKFSHPRTGCEGFGKSEEPLLRAMIAFLKSYPKKPFRKIELHEMNMPPDLHLALIEAFKLSQIHSIVIRAYGNNSALQSSEIQSILTQDVTLKKFKWVRDEHSMVRKVFSKALVVSPSFQDQPNLISAKFHHLHLHLKTIQSLQTCKSLETLVLDQCYFKNNEIKTVLSNLSLSRLKRLELSNIAILSDLELDKVTKDLSNLEMIHITMKNVGLEGFKSLKKNCPHLRALKLHYPSAKDQELEYLAQNFPDLEMLSFEGHSITPKGIEALEACKNLRVLKIGNLKNLETLCLKTLPQALNQLEVLEINHLEILNVRELPSLIESMPKLVYLEIRNGDNIRTQDHLTALRKAYPKLLELPPNRKIQKFLF